MLIGILMFIAIIAINIFLFSRDLSEHKKQQEQPADPPTYRMVEKDTLQKDQSQHNDGSYAKGIVMGIVISIIVALFAVSIILIVQILASKPSSPKESASAQTSQTEESIAPTKAEKTPSTPAHTETVSMRARFTGAAMDIITASGETLSANATVKVTDEKGTRKVFSGQDFVITIPAEITVTVDFSYNGRIYSDSRTDQFDEDDFDSEYDCCFEAISVPFTLPLTVATEDNRKEQTKDFNLSYTVWISGSEDLIESKIESSKGNSQYLLASSLPALQPYCGIWVDVSDYCSDYNHVGNEWYISHYLSFDGSNYFELDYDCYWFNASSPTKVYIKTYIKEYDDSASDTGTNRYSAVLDIDPTTQGSGTTWTIDQWTEITENGGRYIYNSCTWDTTWTFTLLYGEK